MATTIKTVAEGLKNTTRGEVVKIMGRAGKSIPFKTILEKLGTVQDSLSIKYHVALLMEEGYAEQDGVLHTGQRGQPAKLYRLTRSGRNLAAALGVGARSKKAREAKAAAKTEVAPVEESKAA